MKVTHCRIRGSSPLTRGKPSRRRRTLSAPRLIPAHAGKTAGPTTGIRGRRAHPRSRGENGASLPIAAIPRGSSPLTRGKLQGIGVAFAGDRLIPAHAGKTKGQKPCDTYPRAHPRSRGENMPHSRRYSSHAGSSPLTRGKRDLPNVDKLRAGLIPAHAGKTTRTCARFPSHWAHPRSRGENGSHRSAASAGLGSSPLTRGKPLGAHRRIGTKGLIPAHAGKTISRKLLSPRPGAHPRSRGENRSGKPAAGDSRGSSPLTRGKPSSFTTTIARGRLIPAHAGKTRAHTLRSEPCRAHPRSRGENLSSDSRTFFRTGSSPLTRGKRGVHIAGLALDGLIPAHAGKTPPQRLQLFIPGAHPRSRGENLFLVPMVPSATGSSPLTRGKPGFRWIGCALVGLIPAHAGKTPADSSGGAPSEAHPRSRGENLLGCATVIVASGSSPLTRGKLGILRASRSVVGLIPAHAGKTIHALIEQQRRGAHPRSRGEN